MQEKLTIARPYAAAAFAYAAEHGEIETWSSLLDALAVVVTDPALAGYLDHPKVSTVQLVELVAEVLGGLLTPRAAISCRPWPTPNGSNSRRRSRSCSNVAGRRPRAS